MTYNIYWIGDSIAEGLRDGVYGVNSNKLKTLLGSKWNVMNKGIGGQTTAQLKAGLQGQVLDQRNADFVIVQIGTSAINQGESLETMKSNVQDIYTDCYNAGASVIAIQLTPTKGYEAWTEDVKTQTLAFNSWIEDTAVNVAYTFDAYTLFEDPQNPDALLPAYSYDLEHLSQEGYELMGTTVFNTINSTYLKMDGAISGNKYSLPAFKR